MEAGGPVEVIEIIGAVQVAFIEHHDDVAPLQRSDGRNPVNEEGICFGDGAGTDDHQLIDIGYRRSVKGVATGQNGLHKSLLVAQGADLRPIPHQGGDSLLAELASGTAS